LFHGKNVEETDPDTRDTTKNKKRCPGWSEIGGGELGEPSNTSIVGRKGGGKKKTPSSGKAAVRCRGKFSKKLHPEGGGRWSLCYSDKKKKKKTKGTDGELGKTNTIECWRVSPSRSKVDPNPRQNIRVSLGCGGGGSCIMSQGEQGPFTNIENKLQPRLQRNNTK